MPNSATTAAPNSPKSTQPVTRHRGVLFGWSCIGILAGFTIGMLLFAGMNTLAFTGRGHYIDPYAHLSTALSLFPVGFIIFIISPLGWLTLLSLSLGLWRRSTTLVALACLFACIAGFLWPTFCGAIMSI